MKQVSTAGANAKEGRLRFAAPPRSARCGRISPRLVPSTALGAALSENERSLFRLVFRKIGRNVYGAAGDFAGDSEGRGHAVAVEIAITAGPERAASARRPRVAVHIILRVAHG